MSLDKEPTPSLKVVDIDTAAASGDYAKSAAKLFEKAENFDFAARVLGKIHGNIESGAKDPLSEEDLTSLISQAASLDTILDVVSEAENEVAEAAESHNRMGHDSTAMSQYPSGLI
ncbi:MAG: hypothetical protein AAB462_01760 [Patescibacteria group bacterium]